MCGFEQKKRNILKFNIYVLLLFILHALSGRENWGFIYTNTRKIPSGMHIFQVRKEKKRKKSEGFSKKVLSLGTEMTWAGQDGVGGDCRHGVGVLRDSCGVQLPQAQEFEVRGSGGPDTAICCPPVSSQVWETWGCPQLRPSENQVAEA